MGSDSDIHSLERFWIWLVWPAKSWLRHGWWRGTACHGKDGKGRNSACRATLRNEVQRSGLAIVAAKKEKLQVAQYTQARGEQLDKAWVMLGDNQYENQKVIDACAELILASEVRKAAVLQK